LCSRYIIRLSAHRSCQPTSEHCWVSRTILCLSRQVARLRCSAFSHLQGHDYESTTLGGSHVSKNLRLHTPGQSLSNQSNKACTYCLADASDGIQRPACRCERLHTSPFTTKSVTNPDTKHISSEKPVQKETVARLNVWQDAEARTLRLLAGVF
jgi:hypothetical protein